MLGRGAGVPSSADSLRTDATVDRKGVSLDWTGVNVDVPEMDEGDWKFPWCGWSIDGPGIDEGGDWKFPWCGWSTDGPGIDEGGDWKFPGCG